MVLIMKERLDVLLVNRGLAQSREKAKAIIKSGNVYVNGKMEEKAGSTFDEDITVDIRDNPLKYVSRGGLKLEKALDKFCILLEGKTCMDIGASTGGFTDCMLQKGAVRVYSVDVGTDQLAQKLREDNRVISMEQTNIRYLTPDRINDDIAFISIDVAFISLTKVLTPVRDLLGGTGEVIALIKPQFEVGREHVGKKGVVKDQKAHINAITGVSMYAHAIGLECIELDYSPIKGPEGNIEYLIYLRKSNTDNVLSNANIGFPSQKVQRVVEEAHKLLK
jgi:23S rRNA (cytidine1920-2'-O)/16S rRNA (cytidine1409-2'-O)-methyltransferase